MRKRLTVSRGLLLTVPLAVVKGRLFRGCARVGYTIYWRIPQDFIVHAADAYVSQLICADHPAVILWIHNGHVGLRIELDSSTYVRCRC